MSWKRGDIGPDGRVFWGKTGKREWWMTPDKYQANLEKVADQARRWAEANREKVAERERRYREANREKRSEQRRRHYEANRQKRAEKKRRHDLKLAFIRLDGTTPEAWLDSIGGRLGRHIQAIYKLEPDPGQTLAELIHQLSGFPMTTCEYIANPPEPETQPPSPDLF
jgi:hypothetical protein